jgi:hypothetical protein
MRDLAARGLHWQQSIRGKVARLGSWSRTFLGLSTAAVLSGGCGSERGPAPFEPVPVAAEVVLAAGNIAKCGSTMDDATGRILDTIPGTVFTLGDNAFPEEDPAPYNNCYAPTWGRHKHRTYATLGNHEYSAGTAAAESFDYFGDRAGPRGLGYYSFDLGGWHVIVLNIHDYTVGPEQPPFEGSAQDRWLQADLATSSKTCTLAMWHAPRFFSSNVPGYTRNKYVTAVWDRLYAAGVDVVLNGHQHQYERFPPMTPQGVRDEVRGIRQFNAGTGGESTEMPVALAEGREVLTDAFGLLKLTLDDGHYSWEFVPVVPEQFTDSGSGTCH